MIDPYTTAVALKFARTPCLLTYSTYCTAIEKADPEAMRPESMILNNLYLTGKNKWSFSQSTKPSLARIHWHTHPSIAIGRKQSKGSQVESLFSELCNGKHIDKLIAKYICNTLPIQSDDATIVSWLMNGHEIVLSWNLRQMWWWMGESWTGDK